MSVLGVWIIAAQAIASAISPPGAASAPGIVAGAAAAPAPLVDAGAEIVAKTSVRIRVVDAVSSKTGTVGDRFAIELVEPVTSGIRILVPAGARGEGEIVHAAKSGWGGKPGELILAARFLACGERRIPLGHLHFSGTGRGNTGTALTLGSLLWPSVFMVSGKDIVVPAGTELTALVASDFALRSGAGPPECGASTMAGQVGGKQR